SSRWVMLRDDVRNARQSVRSPAPRPPQPPRPGPREPAAAPPARCADPPDAQSPAPSLARQAGLGARPPSLPRLAAPPGPGPARDGRRVAPPRVAAVLVVALSMPGRPAPLAPGS